MDVVIRNLSSRLLYVPLHNRQNVRLAAGASSSVDEVQVKDNPTVEKLLKQRIIAIDAKAEAAGGDTAGDNEARRTRKRADPAS